ncbi:MAG: DUF6778 family protein [Pseudomonadota bacterium]
MGLSRVLVLLGLFLLSACGGVTGPVNDTVSGWQLAETSVRFGPDISRTTSGNDYSANFVWNGLKDGNRKRQVVSLFRSSVDELAQEAMSGDRPVDVAIQINYFHALTRFSRYFCCGYHTIEADLSFTDAETGEVLAQGQDVSLGRIALGGMPALIAQGFGRTQYVRVKEGIVRNMRNWLAEQPPSPGPS